jgi:glycosyltransferase involved in cell wall biosynthesis
MTDSDGPQLDIVIPVYNEGWNIVGTLDTIKRDVKTPARVLICYDFDEDDTLAAIESYPTGDMDIVLVKNTESGPHAAVLTGFAASKAPAVLVYMADDDYNAGIIDAMVEKFRDGYDVVAAARFIPGGCMVGCSWHKTVITLLGTFALHRLARLPLHDNTNAFRLFSRRLLDTVEIESQHGFTFSIELLAKAVRLGWPVAEVAAQWFERKDKPSRFRVVAWIPHYLKWLAYALATAWLGRGPETVRRKAAADPVTPSASRVSKG